MCFHRWTYRTHFFTRDIGYHSLLIRGPTSAPSSHRVNPKPTHASVKWTQEPTRICSATDIYAMASGSEQHPNPTIRTTNGNPTIKTTSGHPSEWTQISQLRQPMEISSRHYYAHGFRLEAPICNPIHISISHCHIPFTDPHAETCDENESGYTAPSTWCLELGTCGFGCCFWVDIHPPPSKTKKNTKARNTQTTTTRNSYEKLQILKIEVARGVRQAIASM